MHLNVDPNRHPSLQGPRNLPGRCLPGTSGHVGNWGDSLRMPGWKETFYHHETVISFIFFFKKKKSTKNQQKIIFSLSLDKLINQIDKGFSNIPEEDLKNLPELAVDLISKILIPTPEARLTPSEALKHPWIVQFLH